MLNSGFRGKRATDGTGAISAQTQSVQATDPVPKITGYAVTDSSYVAFDDTAATSGAIIVVYGNNFVSGMTVYINNSLVAATYLDSTRITFIAPTLSNGTYIIYMTTPQGGAAILSPGIVYSGFPTWTTSNYNTSDTTINIQLLASGDAPLTYSLQGGSTLPTGITLTSTGVLTGTVTSVTNDSVFYFTVIVEDTQLQGTQQSITLTFQFGDSYWKNTTLLLNGETTVKPFINDASTNNFGLTIQGDTKPNYFNPYTPGYYSIYFPTNNDFLSYSDTTAGNFGTGDFTVELWAFMTGNAGNGAHNLIMASVASSTWEILTYGNQLYWHENVGNYGGVGYGTVVNHKWTHIAFSRTGGFLTAYIDGVRVLNSSNSYNYSGTPTRYIGPSSGGTNSPLYISNVRIIKGTGIYSGSTIIVPTAPLTAIANTSLLTCQSNRLIDNSTNNFTITRVGNTAVSSAIPFTQNSSYSTYGSTYFDGTGDYLSIGTTQLWTPSNNLTIEGWFNISTTGDRCIFSKDSGSSGSSRGLFIYITSTGAVSVFYSVSGSSEAFATSSTGLVVANQWYHLAVVKNGSSCAVYLNGVSIATFTAATIACPASPTNYIGIFNASYPMLGYISNLRIVNGTAVYTSAFTPPTSPLTAIANTSLLTLQYNGGATNQGFIDNSNFNNIITRNGNPSQGTFSPYSVTGWSNYFDGSGDALDTATTTTRFVFGNTTNFTIEAWVYPLGYNQSGSGPPDKGTIWSCAVAEAGNARPVLGLNTTGKIVFGGWNTVAVTGATTVPLNAWSHVVVTFDGTTYRVFYNGVLDGSGISIFNFSTTPVTGTVGSNPDGTYRYPFFGYISNVRVLNGTALYTSSFTPSTTPLTAIANTVFLTSQSNRFIDNSPTNIGLTKVGDVSVQAFGPFGSVPEAVPISYSNFFDGTGDYLTAPTNAAFQFGTDDFTIEAWVYLSSGTTGTIFDNRTSVSSVHPVLYFTSATTMSYYVAGGNRIASGSYTFLNRWVHVALCRASGSTKMFFDGVQTGSTYTDTNNFSTSGTPAIGASYNSGASNILTGYISNLRVVKGTALYTSAFTPSTTPLTAIANTSLLTCQSTTMIDNSTNRFTITANGDTKPRIFNPFGYTAQSATSYTPSIHGGSAYFDGTVDNLYSSTISKYGSTNHTIECWVFFNNVSSRQSILNSGWGTGSFATDGGWTLDIAGTNAGGINFALGTMASGSFWIGPGTGVGSFTVGQWYHIAIVRNSTTVTIYSNGVSIATGTLTASTTVMSNMGVLRIGAYDGNGFPFNGYISDVRVSSGALYTSNFVSPTVPLTPTVTIGANTFTAGILVNGATGGIIDQHSSTVLETVGNAQLSTAVKKYNNASMYFDGTGDYLSLQTGPNPNFAMGSGDWTIEMWMYPTSAATTQLFFDIYDANSAGRLTLQLNTDRTIGLYGASGAARTVSTGTVTLNQWNHVVFCKSSGSTRIFIDGTQVNTTYSDSVTYTCTTGVIYIAANGTNAGNNFVGYLDDLRITKGFARYTANFTAPTTAFLGQ